MINERAKIILEFCFAKTPMEKWFRKDHDFDKKLKQFFSNDYERAVNNQYDEWQNNPDECVALIMLLDQFSRNFYRNNPQAYKQDQKCRLIVNKAIKRGYLKKLDKDKSHFLLLPLIHSEDLDDHILGHKLIDIHLKNHQEFNKIKKAWNDHTYAIKKFNRYPHRNSILGRKSSEIELKFLKGPNSSW